jgi:hypothetical protein
MIMTMLLSVPAAYAAEQAGEGHEAHHPGATQTEAASEAKTTTAGMAGMPLREQMQTIREQMQRIQESEDSDELEDMLEDHIESLLDMMKMMHGMMAAQAMMEQGMRGGHKGDMGMMGGDKGGMGMMGHHKGGGMGKGEQGGMAHKGGMMEGHKGGGMGHKGGMMARHHAMVARMDMLERRLNLMQLMMDQMLQNQEAFMEYLEDQHEEYEEKATKD